MTAAHRPAAILAADVAGYSRLMGEEEAGAARAMCDSREGARPTPSQRDADVPTERRRRLCELWT